MEYEVKESTRPTETYRRERSVAKIKTEEKPKKPDYMTGVVLTQIVVFSVMLLILFGFYKAQNETFTQMKSIYHSIMQKDMTSDEIKNAVKTAVYFIVEPQTVDGVSETTTVESETTAPGEEQTAIDELLTGAGGEDLMFPKENTSFAPFYLSEPIVMPVKSKRITSAFGYRINPVTNEYGFHSGVDLAAKEGTEIKAAFDGVVEKASFSNGRGNYLFIASDGNIRTVYCHCSELLVSEGQTVDAGSVIAKVGSTGQATGPHLHFEIIINSVYYNPLWVLEI